MGLVIFVFLLIDLNRVCIKFIKLAPNVPNSYLLIFIHKFNNIDLNNKCYNCVSYVFIHVFIEIFVFIGISWSLLWFMSVLKWNVSIQIVFLLYLLDLYLLLFLYIYLYLLNWI